MATEYDFQDFIETEHLPTTFKVTSGFYSDQHDIAAGEVYTAENVECKEIVLQFSSKTNGQLEEKKINHDFILKFIVTNYGPDSPKKVYSKVSDLRYVCPFLVQCGRNHIDPKCPQNNLTKGQYLRLLRFVNKNGNIELECHSSKGLHFKYLPLYCKGDFQIIYTKEQYTIADLVGIFKRRCKMSLKLSDDPINTIHGHSLPCLKERPIVLLPPQFDVILSRENAPGIIENVPLDIPLSVSPRANDYTSPLQVYYDFDRFLDSNAYLMPFVVKICDWTEALNVFELHGIRPGARLHIFSFEEVHKVMARSEDKYFSIPRNNQIRYSKCSKVIKGVDELVKAAPCTVRIVELASEKFNHYLKRKLSVGQIIKVPKSYRVITTINGNEEETTEVEIFDGSCNSFVHIHLPIFLDFKFEEQIANDVISAKAIQVSDRPIRVKPLIDDCDDVSGAISKNVFVADEIITLVCCVQENCVLAVSDSKPDVAFHLPIHNGLKIALDRQTPVLTKIPGLSPNDPCIEIISKKLFTDLCSSANLYESAYSKVPPAPRRENKPKLTFAASQPPLEAAADIDDDEKFAASPPIPSRDLKKKKEHKFELPPPHMEDKPEKSHRKTAVVSPILKSPKKIFSKVPLPSFLKRKDSSASASYANKETLSAFTFKQKSKDLIIPENGDLNHLSVSEMAMFLEAMDISQEGYRSVYEHNIDGHQFGLMSDDDLKFLKMNTPVVRSFRDKTLRCRKASTMPVKPKK